MRGQLRAVVWKELLDLSRDRRALALMILIPLVGLPLLAVVAGGLSSAQVTTVYVWAYDNRSLTIARWLAGNLTELAESYGLRVNVTVGTSPPNSTYDVEVVLPEGFYSNLTSLDKVAIIELRTLVGSYAAQEVSSLVGSAAYQLSTVVAERRVESLASMANVNVSPSAVLNPLEIAAVYVLASGAAAPQQVVELSQSVRFLEFSLFFVVNPAIVVMSDSFLGEKERKTLETLLSTPLLGKNLVAGKLVAAAIIGLAIAVADSAGVVIYINMLAGAGGLELTPSLIAMNLLDTALLVFMTSSMIVPIVIRSPSTRAAQTSSYAIMMVALAIYFSSLFVNLGSLPLPIRIALMAVPFTEAAMALTNFVLGQYLYMALDFAVLAAFSAAFTVLSFKLFNPEKLVTQR